MAPAIVYQTLISVIEMGCEPIAPPARAPYQREQDIDQKGQGEGSDSPDFKP